MCKKLNIKKGDRYGKLIVLEELDTIRIPSGQTNRVFKCLCDCGNNTNVRLVHLSRGRTISCGCLIGRNKNKSENDIYIRKIWRAIQYRTKSNYADRRLYYDKGVVVCYEWINDYDSFYFWAKENGLKKGLHIDRIDGNGDYEPKNCRVVSPTVNANNRFNTFMVNYKGVNQPFMPLLRDMGLLKNEGAIRGRVKRGWSVDKAIDTPIRQGRYNKKK
jgi:hypothetical protein